VNFQRSEANKLPRLSAVILGGRLDSFGRWILEVFDYRVLGLIVLLAILLFCGWRRFRYKIWPSRDDCFQVGMSLIASIGGITAAVVFLFTKPPAIEKLSTPMLLFLGLIVPIVIFGNAFPRLKALYFPEEVPKPVQVVPVNPSEVETMSPSIKRPKSDGRCVHCRDQASTKDHVFPDSWYPDSTPEKVQRWTVPCCVKCNRDLGLVEKEVFVRLGLCVNPEKVAATGISKRVIRSFGIGAEALDEDEARIRVALKKEVFKGAKPYSDEARAHLLPGIGPHPEAPVDQQIQIGIPADKLNEVARKIIRGCEFWFSGGRIVEPPYEIEVFFAHQKDVPDVIRVFSQFDAFHFGPGFRVRRGVAHDEPLSAIYEAVIWDSLTFYAVILAPSSAPAASKL
jgi:hypothetical protein